jgi:uncharacterized protein (TIGR02588 family)
VTAGRSDSQAIPIWEWIIGGLGLLMVAGVIGFLLYEALRGNQMPPNVKLSVDSVIQAQNGYLVKITAVNQGGSTAKGVIVEGELKRGAEPVERSEATIDYLPPRSRKQAGLFFTRDPQQFQLELRPLGYEDP